MKRNTGLWNGLQIPRKVEQDNDLIVQGKRAVSSLLLK